MVCSKCGAELKEGAKFCVTCGTPVAEAPATETVNPAPAAAPQQSAQPTDVKKTVNDAADKLTEAVNKATKKEFKKPVVLGVCAAAVVLVLVILISIIANVAGGAYKKPINNLAKGINKENDKKIATCFAPNKCFDGDYDDIADSYKGLENVKFKIYDKHKVNKADREKYIERSQLAKWVDEDTDDIKLSQCYKVIVHMEYEYSDNKSCVATELVVGKYKGTWYILSGGIF